MRYPMKTKSPWVPQASVPGYSIFSHNVLLFEAFDFTAGEVNYSHSTFVSHSLSDDGGLHRWPNSE